MLLRIFDRNRSELKCREIALKRRAIGLLLFVALATLEIGLPTSRIFAQADSSVVSTAFVFGGISGFIPFKQSYHLNYSTSLGGIPIEGFGGLGFPLNSTTWFPLTLRYIRRTAKFVSNMDVHTISIEPGVRVYLEKYQEKELRFFGGASVILARSTLSAVIDASQDGTISGQQQAQHDYLNFGLGIDLGLSYPLTKSSMLDGGVHLGILLSNQVASGGLGNIGGVSIGVSYRIGF